MNRKYVIKALIIIFSDEQRKAGKENFKIYTTKAKQKGKIFRDFGYRTEAIWNRGDLTYININLWHKLGGRALTFDLFSILGMARQGPPLLNQGLSRSWRSKGGGGVMIISACLLMCKCFSSVLTLPWWVLKPPPLLSCHTVRRCGIGNVSFLLVSIYIFCVYMYVTCFLSIIAFVLGCQSPIIHHCKN